MLLLPSVRASIRYDDRGRPDLSVRRESFAAA
jgi:hypothetical protein